MVILPLSPHFTPFFHLSFLYVISFSNVSHSPLLNLQLHHNLPSIMEKTLTTTQESPGSNQRLQKKKKEGKKGTTGRSSKRCFAGPSKTLRNTQKKTFFLKSKGVSQDLPACAFSGHCRKTLGCQVLPNMLEEDVVKIRWKRPCH